MASFVKLDSTNLVQNGLDNTWRYEFAGSSVNFRYVDIAVQSISLYCTDFNIDGLAFSNNSFKIEVPTAATVLPISINLTDGWYAYADINRNIQAALVAAGAYLIDGTGNNVFFIYISESSTYYFCQLDCSSTPSLICGYTRPATGLNSSGGTELPTTTRVPRLIIDNAAFGQVLGFSLGTYPSSPTTTTTSLLSNSIPQVHPTSSYIVHCDLIKNDYIVGGDLLTAFDRGDSKIGKWIRYRPSNYAWVKAHDGARSSITMSVWNQINQPIHFRDTSVSIMLLLKPREYVMPKQ